MEIQPATVEQIATFKLAAAQRYSELGIPPELAEQLFEIKLAEIAEDLGVGETQADPKVEKIASDIAEALGRDRMSKEAQLAALSALGRLGGRIGSSLASKGSLIGKGIRNIGAKEMQAWNKLTKGQIGAKSTMSGLLAKGWKAGPGKNLAHDVAKNQRMRELLFGAGGIAGTAGLGALGLGALHAGGDAPSSSQVEYTR